MWTVLLSVIAYVYGFFLTALFFSKALNIRYSVKKTAILTGIFIALNWMQRIMHWKMF